MRLIDADALKETLDKMKIIIDEDVFECNSVHEELVYLLEKVDTVLAEKIDDLPTIEAVPAVHGEWIGNTCSACDMNWDENMVNNADDWGYFEPMPDFCPNCGAKMRTK